MWATVDGNRVVRGEEAALIRRAAGEMLDALVGEWIGASGPRQYGIPWFDQWDVEQRIWLLKQVMDALFLASTPPLRPAAIYEATVDAIFCHVAAAVDEEIETRAELDQQWRRKLIAAFACQVGRLPQIDPSDTDPGRWHTVAAQVAGAILGSPSYQQAEWFRDGDAKHAERFIKQRGLPQDFLQRIPPLCREDQAEALIDAIRDLLNPHQRP